MFIEPWNPRIDEALMVSLKGDGNNVAVAHERIRNIDVETLEVPGRNMRKDHRGCHGNRVRLERGLRP